MNVFYTQREEEDNKKLSEARAALFENKYKFFQIPNSVPLNDRKAPLSERAKWAANRFAPEPNYLHTRLGWSADKILAFARRHARRLAQCLDVIEFFVARERRQRLANKLSKLDSGKLIDYTKNIKSAEKLNDLLDRLEDTHALALNLPPRHASILMYRFWKSDIVQFKKTVEALRPILDASLPLNSSFEDRRKKAKSIAQHIQHAYSALDTYDDSNILFSLAKRKIESLQPGRNWTPQGARARFTDEHYWFKKLGREQNINDIRAARILQMLGYGPGRDYYLPHSVLTRLQDQEIETRDWMAQQVITNGETTLTLFEVTKNALENHYNETVTINIARANMNRESGMKAVFLTITVPSRFHSVRTLERPDGVKKSIPNRKFDPSLEDLGASWFQEHFVRFRGDLSNRLKFGPTEGFDFFIANEGHADSTCHYHPIFWFKPEHEEFVRKTLQDIFIHEDPEPGAEEHRIEERPLNDERKVLFYIVKALKYMLKTSLIDAKKLDKKERNEAANANYTRAIGQRRVRGSNVRISVWRWLRRHGTRIYEHCNASDEAKQALAAAHGDPETHKTSPSHFAEFFESGVGDRRRGWRKVYTESMLYDIKSKTTEDYRNEARESGSVVDWLYAHERLEAAQAEYDWSFDNNCMTPEIEDAVYTKTRKLTVDGRYYYPARPDSLVRFPGEERFEMILVNEEPWENDEGLTEAIRGAVADEAHDGKTTLLDALKKQGIAAWASYAPTKKKPQLQLSISSQGGACGPTETPETRMESSDPVEHEAAEPAQLSAAEHLAIRERVIRAAELFLNG